MIHWFGLQLAPPIAECLPSVFVLTNLDDRTLSWMWLRVATDVLLQTVSIRPDRSGATHQTSIEGSTEVISRSRRLSEKIGEPMGARVAQVFQPSPLFLLSRSFGSAVVHRTTLCV